MIRLPIYLSRKWIHIAKYRGSPFSTVFWFMRFRAIRGIALIRDWFRNTSIYNIIRSFAGPMGQTTCPASVWRSKYFFFIISYRLRALKLFTKKINWNYFFKEFCKILWKKKILGKSDTWLTNHLSQQPSEPAYYIVDCRISRLP